MIAANIQAQFEQTQNHDVTFFAVSNKTRIENCTYVDYISPYFETREQALEFKAQALAEYPNCFTGKHTSEYNAEDDGNRLKLLAKIVKADTSTELLIKLQQALDSTISVLSSVHAAQFGYAIDRVQTTINYLGGRVSDGCTQQMFSILATQIDEIRAAKTRTPGNKKPA
ncbi:MAG: hypothetical protein QX198_17475 [Methylococcaceae bacterium]